MPAPLPAARRSQIMGALAAGQSAAAVARQLGVSRHTVWRYQRLAAQKGEPVPEPQPMGGYRGSTVERAELVALAALALGEPKRTLADLRELGLAQGVLSGPVSLATVSRALHKAGLKKRRARFVDLRTQIEPLIVAERAAFRRAQAHDPQLAAATLLFMDETSLYLNEQARTAWGLEEAPAPVLYKPKGRTQTTGLVLTFGIASDGALLLHYRLYPPARAFAPLNPTIEASELAAPGQAVRTGVVHAQRATVAELRAALQQHNVKWTGARAELVSRVEQLAARGPLGLPRAGRVDLGGRRQPQRSTVLDIARYWSESFVPVYTHTDPLHTKTVVWDNASWHSPVAVGTTTHISLFHRLLREHGLRGCVFLPPRSPNFQPAELAFAYVKHFVRKEAPPEGYTQQQLEAAVHSAVARITPRMVRNWIVGCGYVFAGTSVAAAGKAPRRRTSAEAVPMRRRWADVHGTLQHGQFTEATAATAGLVDITAQPQPPRLAAAVSAAPRRWPGFPGRPPAGVRETEPASFRDYLVDGQHVFEPERIVNERPAADGTTEYRIRWKGYAPNEDTWEPQGNLLGGSKRLLRDWARRHRARGAF